jgi:flavin reductase (DIM6/NTAB) family NADH-FMN oxidoreductase RutF
MPIEPAAFRQALGRFPTGVTVVTFALPDGGVHGITVSSFVSLSLTPPLVGAAIGHKARAHGMLPGLGRFGVSVLADDQAAVSDHFAGRPVPLEGDAFEPLDGFPVVRNAAAQMVCDVVDQVGVGDHTLVVGRIEAVSLRATGSLAYAEGRYGRVQLE